MNSGNAFDPLEHRFPLEDLKAGDPGGRGQRIPGEGVAVKDECLHAAMRINDLLGPRQPNSINETCMIESVGENRVAGNQDRAEQTYVRSVSRTEIERRFATGKTRELHLQVFPIFGIAGRQPRTGRADFLRTSDGLEHCEFQARIARKSEVIV